MTPKGVIKAFWTQKFWTQPCLNSVAHTIFSFCRHTMVVSPLFFKRAFKTVKTTNRGLPHYMWYHVKQKTYVNKAWDAVKGRRYATPHFVSKNKLQQDLTWHFNNTPEFFLIFRRGFYHSREQLSKKSRDFLSLRQCKNRAF